MIFGLQSIIIEKEWKDTFAKRHLLKTIFYSLCVFPLD